MNRDINNGSIKSRSSISQLNLNLNDIIVADINYRLDYFKDAVQAENLQSTWSVNSAFIFSEAFKLKNDWLEFGKLRGSFGKANAIESIGFPFNFHAFMSGGGIESATVIGGFEVPPTQKTSHEFGLELGFIKSRLFLSSTYFNNRNDQTIYAYYPNTPRGPVVRDAGPLQMKGTEVSIGVVPVLKGNSKLVTKLIYADYQFEMEDHSASITFDLSDRYRAIPKWTGSFFGQLDMNRFFTFLLISHQKNDPYIPDFSSDEIDLSATWLRDVSFGYRFSRVTVSLLGRNLWKISGGDEEMYADRSHPFSIKTASLSVTLKI